MPCRSRRIASTRSSRSRGELAVLAFDVAQFLLGEQIDRAEPLALALDALDLGLDFGDRRRLGVRLEFGDFGRRRPVRLASISRISCSISASRRLAPSWRSSARAASARASPTASSAARAALSASARSFSASASLSAAARRSAVAVSISPISAWRWLANFSGALTQFGAFVGRFSRALLERRDLRRGVVLAFVPGLPLGGDGVQGGDWQARLRARSPALRPRTSAQRAALAWR